jgi:hypothetical protein
MDWRRKTPRPVCQEAEAASGTVDLWDPDAQPAWPSYLAEFKALTVVA